jgi:hypothetical protein
MAALFVKHFPQGLAGVYAPEALPVAVRTAVLRDARRQGVRLARRVTTVQAES